MDHEHVTSTFDDDELEEVAGTIGSGHEVTGWIVVELEPRDGMLERVGDVSSSRTPWRLADGRISTE